jgi:hypothetical protein
MAKLPTKDDLAATETRLDRRNFSARFANCGHIMSHTTIGERGVEREVDGICQIVHLIEKEVEDICRIVSLIENQRSTESEAKSARVERHGIVRQEIDRLALKPLVDCPQVTVAGEHFGPTRWGRCCYPRCIIFPLCDGSRHCSFHAQSIGRIRGLHCYFMRQPAHLF